MIDLPHIPPNKTRYGGMTVNERLSTAGLLKNSIVLRESEIATP